jgi:hypothetical protein
MPNVFSARIRTVAVMTALLAAGLLGRAQERDRARILDRYKWNLADLYRPMPPGGQEGSRRARAATEAVPAGVVRRFYADALDKMFALDRSLSRLSVYATSAADRDT